MGERVRGRNRSHLTAWNQNVGLGQSDDDKKHMPLNQPQYLADAGIIYRSLAGDMGVVLNPPVREIPGAAFECLGGPRSFASTELQAFMQESSWDADEYKTAAQRANERARAHAHAAAWAQGGGGWNSGWAAGWREA